MLVRESVIHQCDAQDVEASPPARAADLDPDACVAFHFGEYEVLVLAVGPSEAREQSGPAGIRQGMLQVHPDTGLGAPGRIVLDDVRGVAGLLRLNARG